MLVATSKESAGGGGKTQRFKGHGNAERGKVVWAEVGTKE